MARASGEFFQARGGSVRTGHCPGKTIADFAQIIDKKIRGRASADTDNRVAKQFGFDVFNRRARDSLLELVLGHGELSDRGRFSGSRTPNVFS